MDRLRVVPHFSSEIVEQGKCERVWKSPHARKGDTRQEEREMRHYRQSPSFWPFTADWFWSVKFVSPSKSIKSIQWDSFPHWAVIALVICKLQRIFITSKRESRYLFSYLLIFTHMNINFYVYGYTTRTRTPISGYLKVSNVIAFE